MSRSVVVSLVVLAFLQTVFATIDVSKTKNIEIQLNDDDVVPKMALKNLAPKTYDSTSFIGDLEIGTPKMDEKILRRVVIFDNPTDEVQSSRLTVKAKGIIHYVHVINEEGSFAVVCDHSNTLGSTESVITIRVSPNSHSKLSLLIAANY